MYSEAKWTKPREDCLTPWWWHAPDPETTEIEVSILVAAFIRALQPEYVVETGTAFGQTTKLIGEALLKNGHGELISLEIEEERVTEAQELCKGLPVTVLCKSSLDFHPKRPIDFAFIDSDFDLRVQEFNHFSNYFADQAVIGFHDTGSHKGDLGERIRSLSSDSVQVLELSTPRGVTFVRLV